MLKKERTWEPGQPGWASEPLWLVQRFVNTVELSDDHVHEELEAPHDLRDFLARYAGLEPDAPVTPADLKRATDLRESLRVLLAANTVGEPCASKDVQQRLNREIERTRVRAFIDDGGHPAFTVDTTGVSGALGRILAALLSAMDHESFHRLKACARHSCRWIFFDRSKNRSGTWCSMQVCGNREKVRAYRQRQSAAR